MEKFQSGGESMWSKIKRVFAGQPDYIPKQISKFEEIKDTPDRVQQLGTPLQKELYKKYKGVEHVWQGLDSKGNYLDINGDNPAPCKGLGCYEMVADYERSLNPDLNISRLLQAGAMPEITAQYKGFTDNNVKEADIAKYIKANPRSAEGITGELVNQGAAKYIKKRGDKNIDVIKQAFKTNPNARIAFQLTRDNGSGHAGYITGVDKYKGKEVFVVTDSRNDQVGQTKTFYDPSVAGELGNLHDMTIVEMLDNVSKPSNAGSTIAKRQTVPNTSTSVYTVQKGDSLGKIAKQYGISVAELQRLNKIKDANKIAVNQKLKVTQMGGQVNNQALVEAGEVAQMQDGSIQQVNPEMPTHDDPERATRFGIKKVREGEGGVVLDGVQSVLSDSQSKVKAGHRPNTQKEKDVKVKPEEAFQVAGMLGLEIDCKTAISPAQLYLKLQAAKDRLTYKLMKTAELADKTREAQNSVSVNQSQIAALPTDEEIYAAIFDFQESKKEASMEDFSDETSQYGGVPTSRNGLYEYPKQPVNVPTDGTGNITMQGIPYPVDAYNAETGQYLTEMQPEQEYNFNADNILEVPKAQYGLERIGSGKVKLSPYQGNKFLGSDGNVYEKRNNQFYRIGSITNGEVSYTTKNYPVDNSRLEMSTGNTPPSVIQQPRPISNIPAPVSNPTSVISTPEYSGNAPTQRASDFIRKTDTAKSANQPASETPYQWSKNLGLFEKASVVPKGYTTSTGADSRWKGGQPAYDKYIADWSRLIPNLTSLPIKEQQAAIYDYAVSKNPDAVNEMWNTYGDTQAKGPMTASDPTSKARYADGSAGERMQVLTPELFDIGDPITPNTSPTNPAPTTFESIALPQEEIYKAPAEATMTAADEILGVLDNKDYGSAMYANMKMRNNTVMAPYFNDVRLKRPLLFQEDYRPYLDAITAQSNAALQNVNPNSTTGQAVAAQIASNASNQSNQIQGQVTNRNLGRQIDWENQGINIDNQQAQLDNQFRSVYSDDWAKTLTAKTNTDNQIDAGLAMYKAQQQQNSNNDIIMGTMFNNYKFIKDGNKTKLVRKKGPDLKAPVIAKYGLKKKSC